MTIGGQKHEQRWSNSWFRDRRGCVLIRFPGCDRPGRHRRRSADAGVSLRCEGAGASLEGNLNWDLVPDGNLNWDSVPGGLDLDLGLDADLPGGNLNWDSAPVCTVAAGVN